MVHMSHDKQRQTIGDELQMVSHSIKFKNHDFNAGAAASINSDFVALIDPNTRTGNSKDSSKAVNTPS